jgi:choline dehydrogenase-like flavoprotein
MERGYPPNHDLNGPNSSGIGAIPMNNLSTVRMSTNITHLTPVRHRLNLTVRGGVFVRRVIIEGGQVTGVEAESGGEVFTVACDRVVLSAGALKSPHILMLSGVGPREQLEEHGIPVLTESPGVGQNLFNHPMGSVSFKVQEGVRLTANAEALRFGLRVTSEPPSHPNDVMLHSLSIWNVMTGEMVPSGTARIACALELPDGSGWVRLQSGDPTVQPSINYRYLHNENDMRRMREAVRLACSLLESDAYRDISEGRIAPDDDTLASDDELDSWIRQTLGSSRHVSGTCRIGPDGDAMAVTDQECRVRGVEGLWVADSSIMPQVTRANTNATAIMIGERVADWVSHS